jgi:UDP-N-acetylmuramate--L-alanine ligase
MINLEGVEKIYFIGIGGIGMCATAGIAQERGFQVSGSDSKEIYEPAQSVLRSHHIPYHVGYDAAHIDDAKADLYIASSGEGLNNPEVAHLSAQNIPLYSFSELLYAMTQDQLRVVVSGTHGKSTTSGLLGETLQHIDDSSYMTGAVLQGTESNFHNGEGHYFVFEGDEYKALYDDPTPKFQQYHADILLLTNLEYDHPDMFASFEDLVEEFRQLIANMPPDGLVVYNADNISLVQLMHESNAGQVSYAIHSDADFRSDNIVYGSQGAEFDVVWKKQGALPVTEHYQTNLFGEMNIYNALGVVATLRTLGFSQELVQEGLSAYHGVKRRFEQIGERKGVIVYDDYAHHPTEIKATLAAARTRYPDRRIWVVFEPHTYSRTKTVLAELVESFSDADKVLLSEIYSARERISDASITGTQVVEETSKHHKDVRLVKDKAEALQVLQKELTVGDVVIVMSVGSFNTLAPKILESLDN